MLIFSGFYLKEISNLKEIFLGAGGLEGNPSLIFLFTIKLSLFFVFKRHL